MIEARFYEPLVDRAQVESKLFRLSQAPQITPSDLLEATADTFASGAGEDWEAVDERWLQGQRSVWVIGYHRPPLLREEYAEAFIERYNSRRSIITTATIVDKHILLRDLGDKNIQVVAYDPDSDQEADVEIGEEKMREIIQELIHGINLPPPNL